MVGRMRALVREQGGVRLRHLPLPVPGPGEVRVRVELAGVCRTDLQAARGLLPVREPRILGHEFAGTLDGLPVAVNPLLPCGACVRCAAGALCSRPGLLGIHRDGAFAEAVAVPASCVHPMPAGLSFEAGAYAEPVAAALAVLQAGPRTRERGLVAGGGRIARLVERVLRAHGFRSLETGAGPFPEDAFDFAVETDPAALAEVLRAVRPGGRVVLKSRPSGPVPFDLALAVRKELVLAGAAWAPFPEALAFLASGKLDLEGLLGPALPLESFATLTDDESLKTFLRPVSVPRPVTLDS